MSDEPAGESSENETPDETPDMHPDDTDVADPGEAAADESPRAPTDESTADSGTNDTRDLVRYARYALLGGLTVVALVATFRFYFAVSNAIDLWVTREYRSIFQAAFNLVVLLVAAVGISWEIRKVAG